MHTSDETAAPAAPPDDDADTALIIATDLSVDGEHGPLFRGVELSLDRGFHAIQMPGGHAQTALLMTLSGRLKPSAGSVSVSGDTEPRAIRRHCAIAAFRDIDELEEAVTVETVLLEQRRWLSPWYRRLPKDAGYDQLVAVFGDLPVPAATTYISELSDLELFLLRITLGLFSDRPVLVVGDLEQVRDNGRRSAAVQRLAALAEDRTVVVGVTNPLGDAAPEHALHDHRCLTAGV